MWGRACRSGLESWDREISVQTRVGPLPIATRSSTRIPLALNLAKTGQQLNEERYLNFLPLLWPNAQPQQTCVITVYRHKYWGHWPRECTDPRQPTPRRCSCCMRALRPRPPRSSGLQKLQERPAELASSIGVASFCPRSTAKSKGVLHPRDGLGRGGDLAGNEGHFEKNHLFI